MEQPHLDVRHADVRAWVHRYMEGVLGAGLYTATRMVFAYGEAIFYEPVPVMSLPTLPALPISLN
jgi:hypothetical protein